MKRVAILGFLHESNSFAPTTTEQDFRNRCYHRGDEITADLALEAGKLPKEAKGFCGALDASGVDWQMQPIMIADAEPGGLVDQAFHDATRKEMLERLQAALPLDGVYFIAHGAMRSTGHLDPDGLLYGEVRDLIGPDVPLLVTLDLHANVSDAMVDAADVLIAYRTNPPVDQIEVAEEAARAMLEMWGGMKPKAAHIKLPIAAPTVTLLTAEGPYADLINHGQQAQTDDILNVSVVAGFAFSDSPKTGMSVLVTARDDAAPARALAADIATRAWADHERFQKTLTSVADAVAMAVACGADTSRPAIIMADVADNPGGGGSGATTTVLRALVEAAAEGVVFGGMTDAPLVEAARAAGEGATFSATFNTVPRTSFDEPYEAEATVLKLLDGQTVGRRGILSGRVIDIGPAALLRVGGVSCCIGSIRKQCADPALLEVFGIDIPTVRTVVVKSRGHFRAGFDDLFPPERTYEIDAPGVTSPVLGNFDWQNLARPSFPLDPDTTWAGPPW